MIVNIRNYLIIIFMLKYQRIFKYYDKIEYKKPRSFNVFIKYTSYATIYNGK